MQPAKDAFVQKKETGVNMEQVQAAKLWNRYREERKRGKLIGKSGGGGAGGRTRTDMRLPSPDFESGAYTNFATPAWNLE